MVKSNSGQAAFKKALFFVFTFHIPVETYYYNGLLMLDLGREQIMRIAEELNDSILLATANNFLGLAYYER